MDNKTPLLGYSVIGNTADFDSVILGSSPSSPASFPLQSLDSLSSPYFSVNTSE